MDDDSILSFNFWPSYADLMLSLVLILVLIMFVITAVMSFGSENLRKAEQYQKSMIQEIATTYKVEAKPLADKKYGISISGRDTNDIVIVNEPTVQKITFSEHILFKQDDEKLNTKGEEVLLAVGGVLKSQLKSIREIQIQGHADPIPSKKYPSNLQLGAMRAIKVFQFLQADVGIDPKQNLMSATTFGEYKPVQRSDDALEYSEDQLAHDNSTKDLRDQNRRIELRIFYRY